MFIWISIAHTVLPLGETGIREIPNESRVLAALHDNLGQYSSLYLFPGLGVGPHPTRQQRSEAMHRMAERLARNPSGILMYHPPGRPLKLGQLLGTEFATELLEAILVVFLLAQTRLATLRSRVGFITLAGILAALWTNLSYWNWYGFPTKYTAAYMFTQIVGFISVGLVAAAVFRKRPAQTAA